MYKLQPVYSQNQQIEVPSCMYKLPNIHKREFQDKEMSFNSESLRQLEEKQEQILARLAKLKEEVDLLSTGVTSTANSSTAQADGILDVVVNANPSCPPYSLFVLHDLLCYHYCVMTAVHIHSSVRQVPEPLKNHFGHNGVGSRGSHQMAVTLIWKSVEGGPVMMVDAHKQAPIVGEANIARFLGRLLSPAYDDCDPVTATEIDNWLDVASGQILNGNSKEKAAALRSLNSRLGKNKWLIGDALSLADIVMWSAVLQAGLKDGAPANVKTWLKECGTQSCFKTALQYL